MSVRLSAWKNSAPTQRIFLKFDIWVFLENFRENSSVVKICQEYRIIFHEYSEYIIDQIHSFIRKMRNVSDKSCREYQETHF
jgi:hypothetical protein